MAFNNIWWIVQTACCLLATSQALANESVTFRRASSSGLPGAEADAILERVRSSLDCARMCHPGFLPVCCSFAYNWKSRKCHLYSESYSSTEEGDSFDYFVSCPDAAITPPTLLGNETTAPACPNNNGHIYLVDMGYKFIRYTLSENFTNSADPEHQCKVWCSEDDRCRGFDLSFRRCYLKYRSKDDDIAAFKEYAGWRHFEKRCA